MNVKVTESPDEARKQGQQPKRYFGQTAPFDLGFKAADQTPDLVKEFGLDESMPPAPVVTEIPPTPPPPTAACNPAA